MGGTMKVLVTSDTHYGFSDKTGGRLHKLCNNMKAEQPDVVVHAGDWASHKQSQFYSAMKMFRDSFDCPIVAVRGNHDFWQHEIIKKPIEEIENQHQAWFTELDIHHVSRGLLCLKDWVFGGFDGWYHETNPPTNDEQFMPKNTIPSAHEYLNQKAHKDLYNLIDDLDQCGKSKIILASHFPTYSHDPKYLSFCANPKYHDILTGYCDYLVFGHSHRRENLRDGRANIINAGSDYNNPRYIMLEVD